jgi:hypothetical protein
MKFFLIVLVLPAFAFAAVKPPLGRSCLRCAYRTDYPWMMDTNVGGTAACDCSILAPIKVFHENGKICCHNSCPTAPSYTLNDCSCPSPSPYTWAFINPCGSDPNSKCCDRFVGGK